MPPHLASAPNVNHLWAALLVEELVRQGTTFFTVCPGSRSTPLAVAVAENPRAEALVHWDERAAAFVALGWGRATGRPAAVVTTSGTAVANLLPAAVEADADGVPLLLLTADRPPELRETGANQTVRQPPVFQDVARWALDWPVPTTAVPVRWVLATAAHAARRAVAPPGPVHLNLPFREPLAAVPDGTDVSAYLGVVPDWAATGEPYVHSDSLAGRTGTATVSSGADILGVQAERGLIVVGDLGGQRDGHAEVARLVMRLSDALGWPVLPDVRSPLRAGEAFREAVVPYADLVLASERFRDGHRPEAVLHVGGRIVSKRLARLLADARPESYVHLAGRPGRHDPDSLVRQVVDGPLVPALDGMLQAAEGARRSGGAWVRAWRSASDAVATVLERYLDGSDCALSEPAVSRVVARRSPVLVAAASMPIRDVEAFAAPARGVGREVVANRGASGIDGTVAAAQGYARGRGSGLTALVGDLALLHDQTSLALLREGPPIRVVCINNDGGGIFHRLPIADGPGRLASDTFERMFGTPHGLGFRDAAAQFGLAYYQPETLGALDAALAETDGAPASSLIEVRTNREEQTALRQRVEREVREAVGALAVAS